MSKGRFYSRFIKTFLFFSVFWIISTCQQCLFFCLFKVLSDYNQTVEISTICRLYSTTQNHPGLFIKHLHRLLCAFIHTHIMKRFSVLIKVWMFDSDTVKETQLVSQITRNFLFTFSLTLSFLLKSFLPCPHYRVYFNCHAIIHCVCASVSFFHLKSVIPSITCLNRLHFLLKKK